MPADVQGYLSKRTSDNANAAIFGEMESLHERKLWHQLTQLILDITSQPDMVADIVDMYDNFIQSFELDMNPLALVTLLTRVAAQMKTNPEAVEFLTSKKENVKTHKDASLALLLAIARYHLKNDDLVAVKSIIEETHKIVENNDMVPLSLRGDFYSISSGYERKKGNFTKFYRDALRHLGCIDESVVTANASEHRKDAMELGIAALLSTDIHNFGELIAHPILGCLKGTNEEWLLDLITAFNHGDVATYERLQSQWMNQGDLVANILTIRLKLSLMALVNLVFTRPVDSRVMCFSDIAKAAKIPEEEVELLIMSAMSRNLIEGTIDGVSETVSVFWVQPCVLDRVQIGTMASKLDQWTKNVSTTIDSTHALDVEAVFREE
eukprot:CFRG1593T1